jgi:hypothetical protein
MDRARMSGLTEHRLEGVLEGGIAERFVQAIYGALPDKALTYTFILERRDKDNGNIVTTTLEFGLQLGASHARHGDVQDKAARPPDAVGREKFFRRGEGPHIETELLDEIRQRFSYRLIVVDDRYEWMRTFHNIPATL